MVEALSAVSCPHQPGLGPRVNLLRAQPCQWPFLTSVLTRAEVAVPQGPSGEAPGLGALGLQDIPPSQAEAGVGSQTQAHLKDYGELCLAPSPAPSSTLCEIGREGGGKVGGDFPEGSCPMKSHHILFQG